MDPLTHGLLGAAAAAAFSKRDTVRRAALIGGLAAMAPDLDVLLKSDIDPLFAIEYHRHFTHGWPFAPIGALLVALGMRFLFRLRSLPFQHIYGYALIGYFTHGFLDTCTTYGTRLYWPFSDLRESWHIVAIIDPLMTFPLLILLGLGLGRKSVRQAQAALLVAFVYLAFGFLQHERALDQVQRIAAARGHTAERVLAHPSIGNNLLWRSLYASDGKYYVNAIYLPWWGAPRVKEGVVVDVVDAETVFPEFGDDSVQRDDIRRFNYFSQGYLYHYPGEPDVLADLRYGTMPYDDQSFWGIEVKPETPEQHVTFRYLRDINQRDLHDFFEMVKGNF